MKSHGAHVGNVTGGPPKANAWAHGFRVRHGHVVITWVTIGPTATVNHGHVHYHMGDDGPLKTVSSGHVHCHMGGARA